MHEPTSQLQLTEEGGVGVMNWVLTPFLLSISRGVVENIENKSELVWTLRYEGGRSREVSNSVGVITSHYPFPSHQCYCTPPVVQFFHLTFIFYASASVEHTAFRRCALQCPFIALGLPFSTIILTLQIIISAKKPKTHSFLLEHVYPMGGI